MAAIRSRVTPVSLARCFLRQAGRPYPGNHSFTERWNQRFLQTSHLHTAVECRSPSTRAGLGRRHNGRFLLVSAVAVRHNSSQVSSETLPTASLVLDASIPSNIVMDPSINTQPITEQVFEAAPTVVDVLQGVGVELSLSELGLGSATPVGLVQNLLEFMHMDMGMPWWGAIVVGTVLARIMVFPVIMKGQREAAKLNNVMPEITKLTNTMNEAKRSGKTFDFWGSGVDNPNLKAMKTVFVILPFTINFPTAVFTYWMTSNFFSLIKHPLVRQKLRIPERIKHPVSTLPQNEGFIDTIKKGWKNAQLAQQLEERERRMNNHHLF